MKSRYPWVYLDSEEKRKLWLSNYEPPKEKETRRGIPAGLRFQVLRRDGWTCIYCGKNKGDDFQIEVDHIIPWSEVKKHEFDNLVTSCMECNRGKSNLLLTKKELGTILSRIKIKTANFKEKYIKENS